MSRSGGTGGSRAIDFRALLAAGALVLLAGAACELESPDGAPRVRAAGETLEGAWLDADRSLAVFKGVRYAAPPVGDLRWRPPAPVEARPGVQRAVAFGPACPQRDGDARHRRELAADFDVDPAALPALGPTSEDCLYLNVWTSNLDGGEPQPVMVWIHGGSNVWGSGSEPLYDGARLARRGAVIVTLNYRLGVLGFLAHPALTTESPDRASGNYGLLDQIAALEWIQRNISGFGGDPERVTLFGQSTGGANALYLMTSPLARGLFHRVISQSGAPMNDLRTLVAEELRGPRLEELLGLSNGDSALEELRAAPVEKLLDVSEEFLNQELDCSPVADGRVVPDLPARIFAAGRQHAVPLLIGSNENEWASIGRFASRVSTAGFDGWLRSRWGPWADQARALYRAESNADVESAVQRWQTDHWFACPTLYAARSMAAVSSPAFLYRFTRVVPGEAGATLGAYHGAEVGYAFDNLAVESWVPRAERDRHLAGAIADYWVAFARDGVPRAPDSPEWPPYESFEYLELGEEVAVRRVGRSEACELWARRLEAEIGLR